MDAVQTETGAKFAVDIEGDVHLWHQPTITVPEIRALAAWAAEQGVVIVDMKTNEERDLREDEVIELKPGHGFSKKVKFKRGRGE